MKAESPDRKNQSADLRGSPRREVASSPKAQLPPPISTEDALDLLVSDNSPASRREPRLPSPGAQPERPAAQPVAFKLSKRKSQLSSPLPEFEQASGSAIRSKQVRKKPAPVSLERTPGKLCLSREVFFDQKVSWDQRKLIDSYRRHGATLGHHSLEEYKNSSIRMHQEKASPQFPGFVETRYRSMDVVRQDQSTRGLSAAVLDERKIKTFFRPENEFRLIDRCLAEHKIQKKNT